MDHHHHHNHHHRLHCQQQQQQQHADPAVALDSGLWLEDDEQYDHEPVTVACAYTFRRGVPGPASNTITYRRRRLYAGYRLHLPQDTIGTAIYFTTYESAKQLMGNSRGKNPTTPYAVMVAGRWAVRYPNNLLDLSYRCRQDLIPESPT
ncbi:hypothetical protein KC363_g7907 [Hortaea werneckii]|nr:hypothetical protein KC361_g6890 [Hortaea werneckii]KAI7144835.1 hypothetical protein KC344_g5048 [Hortaea werneckii]KAI7184036.1 hypothetical protein KC363_g7907 [Hortaea werneckii]